MKQELKIAILIIVAISTTITLAGDKYSLSLSGGYTDFRMSGFYGQRAFTDIGACENKVATFLAVESGFNFSSELLYAEKRNLDIGFGLEFLYGSRNNSNTSDYPEFDADRYGLTGDPSVSSSWHYNSNVFFINPYVLLKEKFRFLSLSPYFKATMGIGLCRFNASIYDEDKSFSLSGASFTMALGGTIVNINKRPLGLEVGYRYLKTESIDYEYLDNLSHWRFLNGLTVDLSGLYARTSISFGL